MNIFQCIYCNQYDELVRTGRDGLKARKNGVIMITVAIVVNLCTLVLLLVMAGKASFFAGPAHAMESSGMSGRGLGRIIAVVMLAVVGILVYGTLGKEKYFTRTIQEFGELPPEGKKQVTRKGAVYFLGSIGIFLLLMLLQVMR